MKKTFMAIMSLISIALVLSWFCSISMAQPGASVLGTVKYGGAPPAPKKLDVTKDMDVCAKEGKTKTSEELVVDSATKGLKYVVVSVTGLDPKYNYKAAPTLAKAPGIDQKGCWFHPHVQIVPAKASMDILNNDGILHNIHTYSKKNKVINKAQPKFKKKMETTFDIPEVVSVKCDVHNWMNAWIIVSEHPYYAVTDEKGAFKLDNVPAGKYKLQYWHETLGAQTADVTVPATGQVKAADFEFKPK